MMDFLPLFIALAGYVVGLGAVTVVDTLGFLGRTSTYWTEAVIRAHKVTKPLIWLGMILVFVGGLWLYSNEQAVTYFWFHLVLAILLILNGCFLSFYVSPGLLRQEAEGRAAQLLPAALQRKIMVSFIFSFLGWWGSFGALVFFLSGRL